jgi:ribonuclease HI
MAAFYVLNTDASIGTSKAAIGVVLRQKPGKGKPLKVVAYISKSLPKCDIATAEYLALIGGLRLAARFNPTTLRVFTDSDFIPNEIDHPDPTFKPPQARRHLYDRAKQQIDLIGRERVKVLWVPRDMNAEADQRAADAFFERKRGGVWVRPTST